MVKDSKYYTYQQASLSQKVSFKTPLLRNLAGTDKEISDSIAVLSYIRDPEKMKKLEKDPILWTLGLLDVLRLSALATSEKINEITKLGFMFPKEDEDEDWSEDEG